MLRVLSHSNHILVPYTRPTIMSRLKKSSPRTDEHLRRLVKKFILYFDTIHEVETQTTRQELDLN